MFDIGWTEMAVIAFLALIVIGPKDLPRAMQSVGRWVRKARSLTREFQAGLDDMVREADLEDARKAIEISRKLDVKKSVLDTIDPTGEVEKEARDLDAETRRAARGEDTPAPAPSDSAAAKPETEKGANVISHPAKAAPGNSVTPPPAQAEPAKPAAPKSGGAGDQAEKTGG